MTLKEIKEAVDKGCIVHWATDSYTVLHDNKDQWLIKCTNEHCIGLTWRDEVTMNGKPEDFYIEGEL